MGHVCKSGGRVAGTRIGDHCGDPRRFEPLGGPERVLGTLQ